MRVGLALALACGRFVRFGWVWWFVCGVAVDGEDCGMCGLRFVERERCSWFERDFIYLPGWREYSPN